jgi:hypothetical protein
VQGETKVTQKLENREFQVQVTNCAALSRQVEMYQWQQTERTRERDDNYGGKDKETYYEYNLSWSGTEQDSSRFVDQYGHNNPQPIMKLGADIQRANEVTFGAFTLPPGLAEYITNWQDCNQDGAKQCTVSNWTFYLQGEWFTTQRGNGPEPGDIRVKFSKAPCGPTTVIAVQTGNTFAPFPFDATVSGDGKVNLSGGHEEPLLKGNKKNVGIELDTSSHCSACCGACRGIEAGFASGQHVYGLETSHTSAKDMLAHIASKQECIHKVCKFVGWFMIVFGLSAMFAVIPAVFRFIPFIGTYLQAFVGFLANVLALVLGSGFALITIALAWLRYRPKYAILLICVAGLCFVIPSLYSGKQQS